MNAGRERLQRRGWRFDFDSWPREDYARADGRFTLTIPFAPETVFEDAYLQSEPVSVTLEAEGLALLVYVKHHGISHTSDWTRIDCTVTAAYGL